MASDCWAPTTENVIYFIKKIMSAPSLWTFIYYKLIKNVNKLTGEWRSGLEEARSATGGTHKYLELIYDEGYEIPRPPPQTADNDTTILAQCLSEEDVSSLDKLLPLSQPGPYSNAIKQLSIAESLSENTINNENIRR